MLNVSVSGLAWNNLILSQKDFQALCEILDRAVVVDARYLDTPQGAKLFDVVLPPVTLEARTKLNSRCTLVEFERWNAEVAASKAEVAASKAEVAASKEVGECS